MTPFLFCLCAGSRLAAAVDPGLSNPFVNHPETNPALASAQVTLPYREWIALWETARQQAEETQNAHEPKPPINALLLAAQYDLVLGAEPDKTRLSAHYQVRSLTRQWQLIPLLGGEARLEQADTGQTLLLWQDDRYCLLTKGPGDAQVNLRFVLPHLTASVQDRTLRLLPSPASLNRLRISGIPEGQRIRIQDLTPTETGGGEAVYHLPGQGGEIILSLEDYTPPAPPVPSSWDIQTEVLARYQEGRFLYESRVYARAEQGSGLSLELGLPQSAQAVAFRGDDLAEGQLGQRKNGLRPLHLRWKTRDVLDRKIEVSYEMAQSPLSTEWTLHAPCVPSPGTTRTLFSILAVDGLELAGPNLKDSVPSRRLPEWLREKIKSGDFLTAEAGAECVLQATWLPRIETAQAMVNLAEYETQLVTDGALLVQAQYTIAHPAPLNWRLVLPALEQILTCQINGQPVQPVKRGEKEIEFTLGMENGATSKVAFAYAARLDALDPVSGRIAIDLPRTDLFVHSLKWMLSIPAVYEPTAIEGNVTIDPTGVNPPRQSPESGHVIRLEKELLRAEHPTAEIYYQRRGLTN